MILNFLGLGIVQMIILLVKMEMVGLQRVIIDLILVQCICCVDEIFSGDVQVRIFSEKIWVFIQKRELGWRYSFRNYVWVVDEVLEFGEMFKEKIIE